MAQSSILGGQPVEQRSAGHSTGELGPSDSSDSGSDVQGERAMSTGPGAPDELGATVIDLDSDGDSSGTGDRASADGVSPLAGADILPNRRLGPVPDELADDAVSDLEDEPVDEAD